MDATAHFRALPSPEPMRMARGTLGASAREYARRGRIPCGEARLSVSASPCNAFQLFVYKNIFQEIGVANR
jgi:hypothetical protein